MGETTGGVGGVSGSAGHLAGQGGAAAGSGGAGGSSCATACASYQFCASNKCLPSYDSTRVLPAIDQTSGGGRVFSAVMLTDKPQGDLVIQLSGDLTLSDANASFTTTITTGGQDYALGYARYSSDGHLAWFRSRSDIKSSGRESKIALLSPTDFGLSYVQYDPASGPVAGTYSFRAARINGNTGNFAWVAKYPTTDNASGGSYIFLPRRTRGDCLTFFASYSNTTPGSTVCTVTDSGTSGSVTCSGTAYAIDGVSGPDGTTAWLWGAPDLTGSVPLNPFDTTQTSLASNPYQTSGEDAFIVGVRGASTTLGPWLTEGDYGPGYLLAALPDGNLAVVAGGNGYMTFNGGQSLLSQTGNVLFKLDTSTGKIVWRKALSLPDFPYGLSAAPGGRIAVLNRPSDSTSVDLYDGATGAALSTLPLPATGFPVIIAGETDLVVTGDYAGAYDFNPGPATDQPTATRGVYISRYTF